MYCKFCGKQIDDNSRFCKFCGKKLVETRKVNIAFTKPKIIEKFLASIKKLYEKYRLFFIEFMKDEVWYFDILCAAIIAMWISLFTLAILGWILMIFKIEDNDVAFSFGIILSIINCLILLNWFVNIYNKNHQSDS